VTYAESLTAIGAAADAEVASLTAALEQARAEVVAAIEAADADAADLEAIISGLEARIAELEAQVLELTPKFSTRLAVGVNDTLWEQSVTSPADTITVVTRADGKKVFRAKAGGHAPNGSGSTYARYRIKLPEVYGIAPRGWFRLSGKIRLLTNADHYYSPLRTDNYVGTLKGTTTKVGCSNGSEWRVGFMLYPGNEVRAESTHQGHSTITLWRGTLLPGIHNVSIAMDPQADGSGSWVLSIDGVTTTGTGQTVPSTVPVAERVVTRVVTCIDGANRWTTKVVEVEVEEAVFEAAK